MKFTTQIKTLGGNLMQARPRGLSASKFFRPQHEEEHEQPKMQEKPHIRFPPSSDMIAAVFPVYSNEEYDREAVEDHTRDPKRDEIYDELIDFVEKEMPVHKKSRDSVKHGYLYGKPQVAQAHVRAKAMEANQKMGHRVDPTALLLANINDKQRGYVLSHF